MDGADKQVDRLKRKNPAYGWVLKFGAGQKRRERFCVSAANPQDQPHGWG